MTRQMQVLVRRHNAVHWAQICVHYAQGSQRMDRQTPTGILGVGVGKELGIPGRMMWKVIRDEFWEGLLAEETTGRMITSASRPVACHGGSELLLLWELKVCSQDTDAQIQPVLQVISLACKGSRPRNRMDQNLCSLSTSDPHFTPLWFLEEPTTNDLAAAWSLHVPPPCWVLWPQCWVWAGLGPMCLSAHWP